ncbi:hypothetical protein I7I50_10039 [Histoplasma capsulatum G186AR]|uniref:Uncharacterized protein n=1 Tax=Ajellomyces capsulatus TaxID=5037 RepID=A0A8H7Z7N5_AJECA|nr:hypothetical protein I7I52_01277 [Histoplasma capsulatum]QSS68910.1 hypothetical protein I7I50_10039 [Histoplasma capsulatum G186AR]
MRYILVYRFSCWRFLFFAIFFFPAFYRHLFSSVSLVSLVSYGRRQTNTISCCSFLKYCQFFSFFHSTFIYIYLLFTFFLFSVFSHSCAFILICPLILCDASVFLFCLPFPRV